MWMKYTILTYTGLLIFWIEMSSKSERSKKKWTFPGIFVKYTLHFSFSRTLYFLLYAFQFYVEAKNPVQIIYFTIILLLQLNRKVVRMQIPEVQVNSCVTRRNHLNNCTQDRIISKLKEGYSRTNIA